MNSEPRSGHVVIDEQNPWPGLCPFDEEGQSFFSGRDSEISELARLVGLAPLTVLFGKSGLGKTSLLLAGLFPRLRQQNILPVYLRLDMRDRSAPLIQQAAIALREEIGKQCSVDSNVPNADNSLWEFLHGHRAQWWSHKNQPLTPLFVFDQFEEAFTLGADNSDAIDRLRLDLADLIENRIPGKLADIIADGILADNLDLGGQRYKVMFSFREDFLPEFECWKDEVPSLMHNRLRLRHMTAERALQVVSGITPAGRRHQLVSDETAREIIRFVAAVRTGDEKAARPQKVGKAAVPLRWEKLEIEPTLLSLVCQQLNEKRKSRCKAAIEAELLRETGKAIIADFYQGCIAGLPDKTQEFIEDFLITEGGFRNSYPLQDALDQGFLTDPLLRQLVDCHLLRLEHQSDIERVELIHDRLTDVVREHRDRERELAEQRARRKKLNFMASAIVVLGLLLVAFYVLWQKAQKATHIAQKATRGAIAGKLVMQSRAILEGTKHGTADIALLLASAGFQLKGASETHSALGLQYALNATQGVIQLVGFTDPVLAVSPDHRTVVTVHDMTMRLWDVPTGEPRGVPLKGHSGYISMVAFSRDSGAMVSGSRDTTLRLWDVATGKPRGVPLKGHKGWVSSAAFSPDGKTVVSGSRDTTLRLWDVATGKPRGVPLKGHRRGVSSVAFCNGSTVVSGSRDKTLRLWDVATGKPRGAPLRGHTGTVNSVAFSPYCRTLVSGSEDTTVRLWDGATGRPRRDPLQGHTGLVSSVAFSPDGSTVVSSSDDKTLRLWDVGTGKPCGVPLIGHTGFVSSAAFSSDGMAVVSGSYDGTLREWDIASRLPCGIPLKGQSKSANSVVICPAGKTVVSCSQDGNVATRWPRGVPIKGHMKSVNSVAFRPDSKTLVSGSQDGTVLLWDVATGNSRDVSMQGRTGNVTSLALSPEGSTVAIGSNNGILRLWDVATGRPCGASDKGHTAKITSVAFSPKGRTVAFGSGNGTLRLWEMDTGRPPGRPVKGHTGEITSIAFSTDGKSAVSGSDDMTVRLWDVATGQPRGNALKSLKDSVKSVAFSPKDITVVSGCEDSTLRLWDVATGQPVGTDLQGHAHAVMTVAYSPVGNLVASGSKDMTLRLWDVATGDPYSVPLQHEGTVRSVAFSPDGKLLASGSSDGTVRLWDAPAAWQELVCGKLVRNLSHAEWKQYVGDIPYVKQCPRLPVPVE